MKHLTQYRLEQFDHLVQPTEFTDVTLKSPAISVLHDFRAISPSFIDADTPALDTETMMRHEHSWLKLVIDEHQEMIGILSPEQFSRQHLMQHVSKSVKAKDLSVADLMRPRSDIMALAYEQIQHCSVGDVLHTLQKAGESYCMILDREHHQIRGMISARDIIARLHIAPMTFDKQPAIVNLFDRQFA
jgi:CBS domain containing-hemolysin-like protein